VKWHANNTYYDWMIDRAFMLVPAQAYVGQFLATFKDYPPRIHAPWVEASAGRPSSGSVWLAASGKSP
jgi:hypothetical protein